MLLSGSGPLVSVVGSLKRCIEFWKSVGASSFVLSVIQNGYCLPFVRQPPSLFFANNRSALENSEFVEMEIASLYLKKCVYEVSERPYFISPLSVAKNAEGKRRLILDNSILNFFLPTLPIKYDGIEVLLPLISENSFAFKFDFKSGYHHIDISEEYHTYLGFYWKFGSKVRYFVFAVLPFGMSLGPYIFTKIMRAPVAFWRNKGIRIVLYLDEGIVVADSYTQGLSLSEMVQNDLFCFGIVVAQDKCQWFPSQEIEWLGISFDLKNSFVFIPERRLDRCLESLKLFSSRRISASARQIAGVCGQIISMKLVFGPVAQLKTRRLYEFIQNTESWDSLSRLGALQKTEIRFWLDSLRLLNRRGLLLQSRPEILVPDVSLFTDASDTGAGGVMQIQGHWHMTTSTWSDFEASLSSTWRELRTVLFSLRSFAERLRNKRVKLHTDNKGVISIILKFSPKEYLQTLAEAIFSFCFSIGCVLEPVWIPRTNNEIADWASRIIDLDDWRVRPEIFTILDRRFGPHTIDRFADHKNCQLRRFNSRYCVPGTSGVDAFAQDWSNENNWLVPPLFLVPQTIQHLRECHALGTIVIPKWTAQSYWPLLVNQSGNFQQFVTAHIEYPIGMKIFLPSSQPSSVFNQVHFPSPILVLRLSFIR